MHTCLYVLTVCSFENRVTSNDHGGLGNTAQGFIKHIYTVGLTGQWIAFDFMTVLFICGRSFRRFKEARNMESLRIPKEVNVLLLQQPDSWNNDEFSAYGRVFAKFLGGELVLACIQISR